jgi:coenzyme F420 hydrogenase subunit beta
MRKLKYIIEHHLCLGCGLCEAIGKGKGYKMVLTSKGFYLPELPLLVDKQTEKQILNVCPAINIKSIEHKHLWGRVLNVYRAYSSDKIVRKQASSGGVVSAVSTYLLESKYVDAVMHVGVTASSHLYNTMQISKTKEDILKNSSSRYAPALIFDNIINYLDSNKDTYCFIGKPCDIQGLKLFLDAFPKYKSRFRFTIAIFCAGIPSYNATDRLIKEANSNTAPISVKYRGDGWPGYFKVNFADGGEYKAKYTYAWGEVLGRDVCYRCKICPDGIGIEADISVGDAWNSADGYPTFEENEGRSFVLVRTQKAASVVGRTFENNILHGDLLDIGKISRMQPYQYLRRISVAYKLIPIFFLTWPLFRFNKIECLKLSKSFSIIKGLRLSAGSLKRYLFNHK